ncbi:polysaccharide deacetylase family protein [Marinobacterium aestuariivivens]|uniref:Polysaccharide deacetylase family protein n=1 Tax=Marinobacterium aestuariivivens TaxID=1698799 RepID=A0ABW1ZVI6_9GAMM
MMFHQLLTLLSLPISRNKLSILNYHQVLTTPDPLRPWEPDCVKFDWQMKLLSRHFRPLALLDALDRLDSDTLPSRAVCVTLDDGYRSNLEVALPILDRYQVPATVFVATAFSDGENMWNDRIIDLLAGLRSDTIDLEPVELGRCTLDGIATRRHLANRIIDQLKYLAVEDRLTKVDELIEVNGSIHETRKMMCAEEVARLSRSGIEIGGHTHNHPILKGMRPEQQREEVARNKALLEEWTGKPVLGFAYPNGRFGKDMDEESLAIIRELGFRYAVSTDAGFTARNTNRFALRRFTPWDANPVKFHARMILNLRNVP